MMKGGDIGDDGCYLIIDEGNGVDDDGCLMMYDGHRAMYDALCLIIVLVVSVCCECVHSECVCAQIRKHSV